MNTTIITGYSPVGWSEYGHACHASLCQHLPASFHIAVYCEEPLDLERGEYRPPPEASQRFQVRHAGNPHMRGEIPYTGKSWKAKDRKAGYSFRFDAVKFSRMALYCADAAARLDRGVLVWLDGDVIFDRDLPGDFFTQLLDGCDGAYLDRPGYHPDTAFVVLRLPEARPVALEWGSTYDADEFVALREWHSAYIFDRVVRAHPEIRMRNVAGSKRPSYWDKSPIGAYCRHLKGKRKRELA